jgi:hypothetical protein
MPVMLRCTPGFSPPKTARKKSEMVVCVLGIKREKCAMGMNIVDNYFAALCLRLAVSCRANVSSFVSECSRE